MAVLLLRLAAPLQAWGSNSKFNTRETEREPTKSGVIGMIAAALGIQRSESEEKLKELSELRFGILVEREGKLLKDFHMVHHSKDKSDVTERYYLSDAVFIAALESDNGELLEKIASAVENPVYPMFLGRRSCPPTLPVMLGIYNGKTENVFRQKAEELKTQSVEKTSDLQRKKEYFKYRVIYETDNGTVVQDNPLSFSQLHRKHGYRMKREDFIVLKNEETVSLSEHDPMKEL